MSRAQLTSTVEQNTGGAVAPFVAGKNKIINGDFGIWQRGTSFSGVGNTVYTADRWFVETGGTANITQQAFTPGTAPVAGYEGTYYLQYATATTNAVHGIDQRIEDVRTLAGQTVTISAWMKANAATTITVIGSQAFGSGGSAGNDIGSTTWTLGTSWQRFTWTVTMTSVAGKTIGAGSSTNIRFLNLTNTAFTFQIWGVQVEAGSVATPFTTASGTLQGELAACQRYYEQYTSAGSDVFGIGYTQNATTNRMCLPVMSKRVLPTISYTGGLQVIVAGGSSYNVTSIANINNGGTPNMINFNAVIASGAVAGGACALYSNGATTLGFSAEL
jgi:hypothetical protein